MSVTSIILSSSRATTTNAAPRSPVIVWATCAFDDKLLYVECRVLSVSDLSNFRIQNDGSSKELSKEPIPNPPGSDLTFSGFVHKYVVITSCSCESLVQEFLGRIVTSIAVRTTKHHNMSRGQGIFNILGHNPSPWRNAVHRGQTYSTTLSHT